MQTGNGAKGSLVFQVTTDHHTLSVPDGPSRLSFPVAYISHSSPYPT